MIQIARLAACGPVTIATVRDADGPLVLLTPGSITRAR